MEGTIAKNLIIVSFVTRTVGKIEEIPQILNMIQVR